MIQKHLLDTSVIIEGIASNLVKENKLKGKIIITNASIAELENQANNGLEIGFIGLEELQKLQEFQKKKKITIEFLGPRPNISQIQLARSGEIDALIRSIAHDQKAVLITADKVQAASAKAFGVELKFIEMKKPELKLMLEDYFDSETMSVHIKEKCHVAVKKGHPGNWKLEKLKDKLTSKQVQELAKDAVEKTRMDSGSFVEISRRGSTVAQFRNYRIVIVKPPISDGWEITVVRPIKKLNIEDYNLPEVLFERIKNKARGMLIAGEVGCQPAGSKVLMADGEWKNIEEIKKGDLIISPQHNGINTFAKVVNTTKWFSNENYNVCELNHQKKKLYSCSSNHIIPFFNSSTREERKNKVWRIKLKTAKEAALFSPRQKSNYHIAFSSFKIDKFKDRVNCKIEPYTLGVFLGDGSFSSIRKKRKDGKGSQGFWIGRQLNITSSDFEIIKEISKYYAVKNIYAKNDTKAKMYRFSVVEELAKLLSEYGLEGKTSKDKFIPKEALLSDIEYRKRLLAGLIDTDGYFSKSYSYSITTKSKKLADNIISLVYSLGGRGRINKVKKSIKKYNFIGNYYQVSFYIRDILLPLKVKYKKRDNKLRYGYISSNRIAINIKKAKPKTVYGIGIRSPSRLYITDNFMVTHNSGKSTLAQSIAELYVKNGKITKTIESPRDLQLSDEITQYSKNFTTSEEIHDILFLSRPDNIIFDEIRDTPDFKLFIDLRLAGSNCIGVMHSASPIDAIQRFIGRTETGMIPSVVDTLMFIESGKIKKVLTLKMSVKVPTGMTEQDLARPVVELRNFDDNKLEYEIYSYGEETVVIPVDTEALPAVNTLAVKVIEQEFKRYGNIKAELIDNNRVRIYAPKSRIGEIIGREGSNIEFIEKKLGISIDVEEIKERQETADYKISETKKHLVFKLENRYIKKRADFYLNDEFVLSAIVGSDGEIRVNKKSEIGRKVLDAVDMNKKVELKI